MDTIQIVAFLLIIIAFFCILIYALRKDSNYIDMREIVKGHFDIFKEESGKKQGGQIFVFFVVPLFLATGIALSKQINSSMMEILSLVVSVFLSMLFAMFSIIISFVQNKMPDKVRTKKYHKTIEDAKRSILFESFVCILLLILLFVYGFLGSNVLKTYICIGFVLSVLIFYLTFVLFLNAFIVIKRLSALSINNDSLD